MFFGRFLLTFKMALGIGFSARRPRRPAIKPRVGGVRLEAGCPVIRRGVAGCTTSPGSTGVSWIRYTRCPATSSTCTTRGSITVHPDGYPSAYRAVTYRNASPYAYIDAMIEYTASLTPFGYHNGSGPGSTHVGVDLPAGAEVSNRSSIELIWFAFR